MSQGNMGTYSIGVIADYSQFNQGIVNATQILSQQTKLMADMLNAMNLNASKSMSQMAASISTGSQQAAASLNGLNSSMNSVNTQGLANATGNLSQQHGNLQNALKASTQSTNMLNGAFSMLRSHLEFMATGALIAGLIAIPAMMIKTATETEVLNQKIKQNLELSDQYHNNSQLLEDDLKRLNDTAGKFAVGFGVGLPDVMESMQILSRRFKDVESISYLTSVALTMNKLDFVDLKKASTDLEAVMLQFGLTAQGTKSFLNDFTIAVHTARITGTELMDALQRSGSSFKQFNMGTREAIAAIGALSTETARSGGVIGNSMKSIIANFNMKKAVEALETYNIKLYDVNENGLKTMRKGANVFEELQTLYSKLDDEGKNKLSLAIAGGKYHVNEMQAFLGDTTKNFTKLMSEMNEKSSDAMTQQLLKTGMETFATNLGQMKAAFQVFAQTIGNQILPSLKQFTVNLTGSIMWLKQHSDSVMNVARVLGDLLLAYTAIKAVTLTYAAASALVSVYTGLQAITTAGLTGTVALATVGTWAQSAANVAATASAVMATMATEGLAAGFTALWVATGPVGWVVLGITALGVAIYEIYNNWAPILQWMKDTWNSVVSFIADHIGMIMFLFPPLGAAILLVSVAWEPVVNFLKSLWAGFISFMQAVCQIFISIFDSMCTAFPLFIAAAKVGISNFASIIGSLIRSILPAWGNDVINFFVNLGSKLASITAMIGSTIRKNLTLGNSSMGSFRTMEGAGGQPAKVKSPFELAQEQAEAAFKAMNSNPEYNGGGGGFTSPELGNQIHGKDKKGAKEESAYSIAKREYQEEIADQELTAADKIEIYKKYLEDVKKIGKEETNYKVGLGHLEMQAKKDDMELEKALLDQQIAQNKIKTTDAYTQNIALLQKEADATKSFYGEKSKQYVEAMTKVYTEENKLRDFKAALQKEELDRARQHELALLDLFAQQNQYLRDNGLISEQQLTRMVEVNEMARYRIKKEALNKALLDAKNDEKQQAKIKSDLLSLEDQFQAKKLQLEQKAYQEAHKYQLSAFDGFKTGMTAVLNGLIHWNMTIKSMFRELGKAILDSVAQTWVKGIVDRMAVGFAKMIGLSTVQKGKDIAAETSKQAALTGVVSAGETARLLATKTSITAAGVVGAAGATAMVGATAAAFTATLAMIAATAAAIATILPAGPGIAAAITAGVATSTATLAAAGATATASIAAFAVPSFDVGTMNVPHDMLANIHKGEIIIPEGPSTAIRDFVSGGGSALGMGGDTYHISIPLMASAIDAKGMDSVLKKHGDTIGKVVQNEIRKFKYKK